MTHIKTTSAAEEKMRKAHPVVKTAGAALAGAEEIALAKQIITYAQASDRLLLKASELKARLMEKMGDRAELRDGNGALVASWVQGGVTQSVDYAAMVREFKVPQEWILAHTVEKQKGRTFRLED